MYLFIACLLCHMTLTAEAILISNFSESEYESVERVFANNTGHIDKLVDFIDSTIQLEGQLKESFLDIGAGPATITDRLSKFFKSTTVIEPNRAYESLYQDKGFAFYIDNFQDAAIDEKFDFVLCSHVLYHVPHSQWPSFVKKVEGLIRLGGKGLVSLVAPKGPLHELRSSINPDYSNSGKVEAALKEENIPYDLFFVQSLFTVPSYEDFRALVRLFTIDDCYLPQDYRTLSDSEKALIDEKIDNYIITCRQPDGTYKFADEDTYIVLHKN